MDDFSVRSPISDSEYDNYIHFRWSTLRKPLGMSRESSLDNKESSSIHLIGIINKEIVACGRLHFNNNIEAQIRYMSVNKNLKRLGYGSKILSELESYAKRHSAEKIILNARETAKEFYVVSGYKEIAPFKSVTGIPHIRMSKTL
mgnify:FL=1